MLKFAMGEDSFQSAIRVYLKDNNYTTAITPMLWDSINKEFPTVLMNKFE